MEQFICQVKESLNITLEQAIQLVCTFMFSTESYMMITMPGMTEYCNTAEFQDKNIRVIFSFSAQFYELYSIKIVHCVHSIRDLSSVLNIPPSIFQPVDNLCIHSGAVNGTQAMSELNDITINKYKINFANFSNFEQIFKNGISRNLATRKLIQAHALKFNLAEFTTLRTSMTSTILNRLSYVKEGNYFYNAKSLVNGGVSMMGANDIKNISYLSSLF